MFCNQCGFEVASNAAYCTRCGAAQLEAGSRGQVSTTPTAYTPAAGGKAETTRWISQGWELVKSDLGNFILMTVVMLVVGGAVPLLLHGPLAAGFQGACKKKLQGHRIEIGDLFQGFQFFGPTLVAYLLIMILSFIAFLCFIIPGLVVTAMYSFTYLFIIDKKLDYLPAMRASASVVKQDYVGYTLFVIALGLLNIAGVLCLVVGLLVTIPISLAAITIAYRDAVGFD